MTQDAAAKQSGGILARTEIAKLEGGYSQARTTRIQDGLAHAYSVPSELIGQYLHGKLELEDLLSHGGPGGYARLGNLEAALSFHEEKWAPPTIAATRAFALGQSVDPRPAEWAAILDRVEEALIAAGLVTPGGDEPPPSSRKR